MTADSLEGGSILEAPSGTWHPRGIRSKPTSWRLDSKVGMPAVQEGGGCRGELANCGEELPLPVGSRPRKAMARMIRGGEARGRQWRGWSNLTAGIWRRGRNLMAGEGECSSRGRGKHGT